MPPPIPIPPDVRDWLHRVFVGCNGRVSQTITQVPTIHEVPLDMTFIQHFLGVSAPRRFQSGWTVEINTHYLGGGRHYAEWDDFPRRWEIADIGLLVIFREAGKVLRSKVALLQSKRLYPDEQEFEEDVPPDYIKGFGRLFPSDDDWAEVIEPRKFEFTLESRYKALLTGNRQYQSIAAYENQRNIPVYYLLYNPSQIPSSAVLPLTGVQAVDTDVQVGCRVVPANQLRTALSSRPAGHSPTYSEIISSLGTPFGPDHPAGWRLEHFVVALLLECETGYIAESREDSGLNYIFYRRTGPISAALAITLDAP
jgi:hypothetical protein